MSNTILITGGSGFIGSALIRHIISNTEYTVLNIDKLTYSGNPQSLADIAANPRYNFLKADITDIEAMRSAFNQYHPFAVMNLAAESHVDRSIDDPTPFIKTNIEGTFVLLEEARRYIKTLHTAEQNLFKFHHISTDEVFGDLGKSGFFNEKTAYKPSSPYSASKASSDHLIRAWQRTYSLPTLITNCSNNYGPRQYPEKLIPLTILHALSLNPLPVYGKGNQIRDWLYVEDHAKALIYVLEKGKIGETYAIGSRNEQKNITIVESICNILEDLKPIHMKNKNSNNIKNYKDLICHVADRPGHDLRYAIDPTKIMTLGWKPEESFSTGLTKTVQWYLDNEKWWKPLLSQTNRRGINI